MRVKIKGRIDPRALANARRINPSSVRMWHGHKVLLDERGVFLNRTFLNLGANPSFSITIVIYPNVLGSDRFPFHLAGGKI
jgi:hypothetical protein